MLIATSAATLGLIGAGCHAGVTNPQTTGTGGNVPAATGGAGNAGSGGMGGAPVVIAPPPASLPAARACATGTTPGPPLLRRLSTPEFEATIRDLFKDPTMPVASVFDDPNVLGFKVDANALLVQDLGAQRLRDSAEEIAHRVATTHLTELSPCTTMDASCRRQFISTFGKRAFRAPLAEERIAAYDGLFAAETTFADGVEAVVAAMLQSPHFLYRTELGGTDAAAPGTSIPLTQYEIASALAYLLLGSMPDDALLAAADGNILSSVAQLDQQTERLLADPRSADALFRFAAGWLQLGKLQTTVKDDKVFAVTDALRADMLGETRALFLDAFTSSGSVATLLTSDYSFLNRNLAQFYGLGASAAGDTFSKVPYGTSVRRDSGILAHASILTGHATAAQSSPTQRGKLVRTRLLCLDVPPMPNNLDTTLKERTPTVTTRQHYEQHATSSQCSGCHRLMDPVGFGFEHYDGFGRYRDQENGMAIDDKGTLNSVREGDVPFTGLRALATYLANSDDSKSCLIRYWSYYAYGSASWSQDGCTYDSVRQAAASGNFALRAVLKGIIHAPHFSARVKSP